MKSRRIVRTLILLIVVILLIPAIPYFRFLLTSRDLSGVGKKAVTVIAHRGASGYYPENTLISFEKAIEMGADVIELDVHLTRDDSLVVMHDPEVSRTTNGEGAIVSMPFEAVRKLDAGGWFDPKYNTEKVPTLDEVLVLAAGRAKVLIELKWPKEGIYDRLVEKVVKSVRAHHAENNVILQSFETEYLVEARRLAPELSQQQLILGRSKLLPVYFDRKPRLGRFMPQSQCNSVNLFYLFLNADLLEEMHGLGKTVYVFTPNSEDDMRRVIHLSADGIITNYPDRALKLLGR